MAIPPLNAQSPLVRPIDASPAKLRLVRLSEARRGMAGQVALVAAHDEFPGVLHHQDLGREGLHEPRGAADQGVAGVVAQVVVSQRAGEAGARRATVPL